MQCSKALLLIYLVYGTRSKTVVGGVVDYAEEEEQEEEEEVARCVNLSTAATGQETTGQETPLRYHT